MARLTQFISLCLAIFDLAFGRNIERRAQQPAREFKDEDDIPSLLWRLDEVGNDNTPFPNITGVAAASRPKCDVSICNQPLLYDEESRGTLSETDYN